MTWFFFNKLLEEGKEEVRMQRKHIEYKRLRVWFIKKLIFEKRTKITFMIQFENSEP